jgi:TonB family protein
MFTERIFQVCFSISILVHAAILLANSNFSIFSARKPQEQWVKVSYVKVPQPKESVKPLGQKRETPLDQLPPKITPEAKAPLPYMDKENLIKANKQALSPSGDFSKPEFTQPDMIAIKKKITLPPVDMEKIDNPSYISYYQIVREKIKRAAYQNYNRTETGEAYLSFIVSKYGALEEVRLVEEKSSANSFLRQIALRSIRDAAPFPFFPKELDYQRLSFNVVISFEVE